MLLLSIHPPELAVDVPVETALAVVSAVLPLEFPKEERLIIM